MFEQNRHSIPEQERHERPVTTATCIELGKRRRQEDYQAEQWIQIGATDVLVAAVADGHRAGGDVSEGARASQMATDTVMRHIKTTGRVDEQTIQDAFAAGNAAIESARLVAGTTLSVVVVTPDKLHVAWVGNTEVHLYREDTGLTRVTTPHESKKHPQEAERLAAMDAVFRGVEDRPDYDPFIGYVAQNGSMAECSRALGDIDMEPAMIHDPELLHVPRDASMRFVVMATDGFWHAIERTGYEAYIENALDNATSAEDALKQIQNLFPQLDFSDNTCIKIIDLKPTEKHS